MNASLQLIPMLALGRVLEYTLFSGAILLVAGAIMFWAAVIRKPNRNRRYKYHRAPRASASETAAPSSKRRRRSEPPRNPTLAETRGLPPLRQPGTNSNENYQY